MFRSPRIAFAAAALCLAALTATQDAGEPSLAALVVGETLVDAIEDGDPEVHPEAIHRRFKRTPILGKVYRVALEEAGPYTLELRSYFFEGYLVLRDPSGAILAEDRDGLLDAHPRVVFSAPRPGAVFLVEACALRGGRGPFELTLRAGRPPALTPEERDALLVEDVGRRAQTIADRDGHDSLAYATALNDHALALQQRGRYAEAREPWERALAIREARLGPEHPEVSTLLLNLGGVLEDLGELDAALSLVERGLAIREVFYGEHHQATALALNNLALLLKARGEFEAALPLAERALAAAEASLGENHPGTASNLMSLAGLLQELGEFSEALALYERAAGVWKRTVGPRHPGTAAALNNLAQLQRVLGDLAGARAHLAEALAILEATLGPDHPQTANCLSNLAVVLGELGETAAARAHFERSLATFERNLGPDHYLTAEPVGELASHFQGQGDVAAARPLFERALAIREAAFGPDHPAVANSLNDLGGLLASVADHEGAARLYERALAIRERAHGPEHPDLAPSLNNLSVMRRRLGDVEAALSLSERALAILAQAFGEEHPDTARAQTSLATLLTELGRTQRARALYERALATRERLFGPQHAATAESLYHLGLLLDRLGEDEAARAHCSRAASIWREALGLHHDSTARVLHDLALMHADAGDRVAAWRLVSEAGSVRQERVRRDLLVLAEAERYPYLAQLFQQLETRLSIARLLEDPAARVAAYEAVLAWKGQVGRMLLASRAQLGAALGGRERELLDRLRASQSRLSALAFEAPGPEPGVPEAGRRAERIEALRDERARLERELQAAAGQIAPGPGPGFAASSLALAPDEALLDFLVHRVYRPGAPGEPHAIGPIGEPNAMGATGWLEPHVTAWITRAGSEAPVEVDLGPASELSDEVRRFLAGLGLARAVANLRGVSVVEASQAADGTALAERLWRPLAPHLAGVRRIFLSPDDFLGALPFGVLPAGEGTFLVEHTAFVILGSGAELAPPTDDEAHLDSLLAVGGVAFPEGAAGPWEPLPGTRAESSLVAELHARGFGDEGRRLLLQEDHPHEGRLKRELPRHAVLHLATHGFFHATGLPAGPGAEGDARPVEAGLRRLVESHPGLLAGLVCAGGEEQGAEEAAGEDGLLTAEEVGWLDLSAVELVVLSACETALGSPRAGEGLHGLRRAFHTAGARTVVSSLWSVPDASTAELMQAFYENLFLKGMGRHEALRAAQLAMLQRNRRERGEALPSTWGAFVLSGEWR